MQIICSKCGCVGINFPPKWARNERDQHRAKHRALGINGHVGDVDVIVKPDDNLGNLAMFSLPAHKRRSPQDSARNP